SSGSLFRSLTGHPTHALRRCPRDTSVNRRTSLPGAGGGIWQSGLFVNAPRPWHILAFHRCSSLLLILPFLCSQGGVEIPTGGMRRCREPASAFREEGPADQ